MCPRLRVNESGQLVTHVLAIETPADGVILVDTGFGTAEIDGAALPGVFRWMTRASISEADTAVAQLAALGFAADAVRHIVVTHLDLDHAGGLRDFPNATVHVHARELAAAEERRRRDRMRYLPHQIEGVRFQTYDEAGDRLFGLDAVRKLEGIEADVAMVPLFGHSRGHSGIAVAAENGWLLHAGDAYFHHSELDDPPRGTAWLNVFQKLVQVDGKTRRANRLLLGELHRRGDAEVFSAHDPTELERMRAAGRAANSELASG